MARVLVNTINKPVQNYLINGNFYYWQRATSFTGGPAGGNFRSDRWRESGSSSGTATIARTAFTVGQTDVPGNPVYYFKWNQTVAASTPMSLDHRIEDVTMLSGKTVYLSFYARNNSGPLNLIGQFYQSFGTGGSPSSVVNITAPTFSLTTSWQKFTATIVIPSVVGKTLGSDVNHFTNIGFIFPSTGTWNVDIAQVMLSEQASDFRFHGVDQADELRFCQRYYEKSYNIDVTPGINAPGGAIQAQRSATANSEPWPTSFKVAKRAANAQVRVYSTVSGAVDNVRDQSASADRPASATQVGTFNFTVQTSGPVVAAAPHAWHFTAEAEL